MYDQHEHSHCIETAVEAAERVCADRNLRFTELRRRVLELVWQNHGAAKAYDLLEQLGDDYSAKPPTVYRALDFLQENGLVHKINSLNAYVGCEHPLEHNDCFFLICSNCEEVAECCAGEVAASLRKMVRGKNFKPTHTTLEIEGLCSQCQGAKAE